MQSRFFFAGLFALAVAAQPLTVPSALAQDGPPPSGEHAHRPMPKPVNLKVLPRDINPEDLIKIMRGISGSLGVECSFCHEVNPETHRPNFASDAKPDKQIARVMMQMTHTINQQYLAQVHDPDAKPEDKHVSCGTCHRGHAMPPQFVPPPEHHGPGDHHDGPPAGGDQHPG